MHIIVKNLNKTFGSFQASKNITFDIEKGKLIGLLGPSGGGKTTILRMLAGLEEPDTGDIFFHGEKVNHLPPQQRGIGFVFQNYALFKHMTVFDNIAFGLEIQKKSKKECKERVEELLKLVSLEGMGHRYPHQLSGGQRQRVAFARALAPNPHLLLLDEPFAGIDPIAVEDIQNIVKGLIQRGIGVLITDHNVHETLSITDKAYLLFEGTILKSGTAKFLADDPEARALYLGDKFRLDRYD